MLAHPSDHSVARIALPRADAKYSFFRWFIGLGFEAEEDIKALCVCKNEARSAQCAKCNFHNCFDVRFGSFNCMTPRSPDGMMNV